MDITDRPEAEAAPGAAAQGFTLGRVLALVGSLAITIVIVIFRNQLARFEAYGYLGVFILSLLGTATVLFPLPGLFSSFAGGAAFNWLITGLVAGVAEPLGELTSYLAGYGGQAVLEKQAHYARMRGWMERHSFITILVLSAIPNPLFDLAGLTAGALHMPIWKFLLACWPGKTAKTLVVAWLGSLSVQWLAPILRSLGM